MRRWPGSCGLAIGSFLNVVIHRLPLMLERQWRAQAADLEGRPAPAEGEPYNLVAPRSRCPACQAPDPRHPQHPGPELARPPRPLRGLPRADFARAIRSSSSRPASHSRRSPGISASGCPRCSRLVFTAYLVALTGIDVDRQLLPDILTIPLLWIGLIASLWHVDGQAAPPAALRDAVIGAVAGYVFLWLVFQLFKLATGKEGMGYGDFKLFAAIGAWLGWQMLPLVLLLAAVGRRGGRHRDDGGAPARPRRADSRSGPTSRAPPGSRCCGVRRSSSATSASRASR